MIIKRRIIKVYDDNFGLYGWRVKNFKWSYATNYQGITHDILEHGKFDQGTLTEEIAAYGRMWAYRGDSPHIYDRYNQKAKIIKLGEELWDSIIRRICENKSKSYLTLPPKLYKRLFKTEHHLVQLANTATSTENLSDYDIDFTHDDLFKYVTAWLIYGYRHAMKTINTLGYHPGDLWGAVSETIKDGLNTDETELLVYIDTDRCYCSVRPIWCKAHNAFNF